MTILKKFPSINREIIDKVRFVTVKHVNPYSKESGINDDSGDNADPRFRLMPKRFSWMRMITELNNSENNDYIDISMFYSSDEDPY